ncbi:hypothetical protein HOG98_09925 [bacterium]|nr:hypothetical protein [bacterium]
MNKITRLIIVGILFVVSVGTGISANADSEKIAQVEMLKMLVKDPKPIQLKFKDTEIKEILSFFSQAFGLNIVTNPKVIGKVSFDFDKISVQEAFNSVVISQGLDWHLDGNVIFVYPQQPIEIFNLDYAKAEDVLDSLSSIVNEQGHINFNEVANSLVVQAPYEELVKIRSLVKQMDVRPRQILVEVKIMEIQADGTKDIGVDLGVDSVADSNFAQTAGFAGDVRSASPKGLFVEAIAGDFSGVLESLTTRQDTEVLATPRILALNHKESSIITGQRLGYKTDVFSSEGTLLSEAVEFLEVGTKLTFTPHISSNGEVIMDIKPEVSEGDIIDGIPQEDTTETTATVLVKDGQTIMISGLIRERTRQSVSGVPILMDLPFVGGVFRNTSDLTQKRETVVFITPHIIDIDNPVILQKTNLL